MTHFQVGVGRAESRAAQALRLLASIAWWLCALRASAQSSGPSPVAAAQESARQAAAASAASPPLEELSVAELDALGLEQAGPRVDTDFHFWGFADFTSYVPLKPRGPGAIALGNHQAFYVGNFNVYLSKNLSESFRTMGEVRFTYLPNGSYSVGANGYQVADTSTVDYANGQSVTRWGGIIIERVYLEWTLHRFITVRGGQFLTPLGIWNVDHGSPAYIPAQRPLAITSGLFPLRQTGLEVLGRWDATNTNAFGYHLTLSNGTGPISEYKDLDRNKAVGGRLYWERFGAKTYVRTGVSGYYGRDTNATPTADLSNGKTDLTNKISSQADLLTLAGDLMIKRGGLHLQTEWITQQRRFTEAGRTRHPVYFAQVPQAASADTFSWSGYVLAAYRISQLFALTPFVTVHASRQSQFTGSLSDARFSLLEATLGLNVRPIDAVVFKLEYAHAQFPRAIAVQKDTVRSLVLQAAWSF